MKKIHIALGVSDIAQSVEEYSKRLESRPAVVVPGEYALWRTDTLNFSIRQVPEKAGTLRHLGWEDPNTPQFTQETDVNGIVWERFNAEQQRKEIQATWPEAKTGE